MSRSVDCRAFEMDFERLLDGQLEAATARACLEHATDCAACGALLAPFVGALEHSASPDDLPDLVSPVLAATVGSTCATAESWLVAYVDEELAVDGEFTGVDRELVASHLSGCPSCRGLARVVAALTEELPRSADIRPDAAFVDDVLRTSLPVQARARRWWHENWPRWVQRPRFAMEAAYIGAFVLLLLVQLPGSPLTALPSKVRELGDVPPSARLEDAVQKIEEGVSSQVERTSETVRQSTAVAEEVKSESLERGRKLVVVAGQQWKSLQATFLEQAASLLETPDDDATESENSPSESEPERLTPETKKETS